MDVIKLVIEGLTSLATIILIVDLILRNQNTDKSNYLSKIKKTFYYIDRLYNFGNVHFFNIYRYIEYKSGRTPELDVDQVLPNGQFMVAKLTGSVEVVRRNLIEIYLFLKEINCLLVNPKYSSLIDQDVLIEAFGSYAINLNCFFTAAFEMVSSKEVEFGKIEGYYGDFSREGLVWLIESLKQNGFKFLR